jgi:alpha-1,2-mannosyltransferase
MGQVPNYHRPVSRSAVHVVAPAPTPETKPTLRSRIMQWAPAALSFAAALTLALYFALRTYEVDLGVYLRLGGQYVFTSHLYSFTLPNTGLLFTYPPFAALLFAPWQRAFTTVDSVQLGWTLLNLGALVALLALSLRLVKPELGRMPTARLTLLLTMPALLFNPVFLTVGFGQINLVVTVLVLWDLLTPRRIGRFEIPLGVATGLAAAVKLTPLIFIPYLLLTGRARGARNALLTFAACGLVTLAASPRSSIDYWTKALFEPARTATSVLTPGLSFISNQSLWSLAMRLHHGSVPAAVMVPLLAVVAAAGLWLAALAHRRSSPMLGVLVCATTSLIVSPVTWAHHMVWIVPAILWLALAEDRPRYGRAMAVTGAVLFWSAPIWWVPHARDLELHLNAWQLVAGNSFFLATVLFMAGAAVHVSRRHRALPARVRGVESFAGTRRTIRSYASRGPFGS